MGIYDSPQTQTQPTLEIDLFKSNIIAFGGAMSGKTTFIKTMLVRLHELYTPQEENIYIIDFGGNMGRYKELSHVCACFDNSNEENIKRIFKVVEKCLDYNTNKLQSESYINYSGDDRPPHITFIIENVNAFLAEARYTSYHEKLLKLCRDGLSKGVTIVLTANDVGGGLNKYLPSFAQKLAFEMPADKYIDIFNTKVSLPMMLKGRGLVSINSQPHEFQCFLPFENEADELPEFIKQTNEKYKDCMPEKLSSFNQELTLENFNEFCTKKRSLEEADADENSVVVGLDYYEHEPIILDLNENRAIAIYGKRKFGKSNLVNLILKTIIRKHSDYRFVFFDDGRAQLEPLHQFLPEGENNVYITKIDELNFYLYENGYCDVCFAGRKPATPFAEKENPFTVFVMQNKNIFQAVGRNLISKMPSMISEADEKGYLFIYSDVRKFSDNDPSKSGALNNSLSIAFLLDNIGEFVGDKGSKSVFGEMEPKELKEEYAKCELGDGYFYDIESDELKKLKFIHEGHNE